MAGFHAPEHHRGKGNMVTPVRRCCHLLLVTVSPVFSPLLAGKEPGTSPGAEGVGNRKHTDLVDYSSVVHAVTEVQQPYLGGDHHGALRRK